MPADIKCESRLMEKIASPMEECWNAIYLLVKSSYAKSLAIQQCVNVCIDMFYVCRAGWCCVGAIDK